MLNSTEHVHLGNGKGSATLSCFRTAASLFTLPNSLIKFEEIQSLFVMATMSGQGQEQIGRDGAEAVRHDGLGRKRELCQHQTCTLATSLTLPVSCAVTKDTRSLIGTRESRKLTTPPFRPTSTNTTTTAAGPNTRTDLSIFNSLPRELMRFVFSVMDGPSAVACAQGTRALSALMIIIHFNGRQANSF